MSSTADGWPSTAAERKTASGSSCLPSQLLPSVRPRPSPAASRGSLLPPPPPRVCQVPGSRRGRLGRRRRSLWRRRGGPRGEGAGRSGGNSCRGGTRGERRGPGVGATAMRYPEQHLAPSSRTGDALAVRASFRRSRWRVRALLGIIH